LLFVVTVCIFETLLVPKTLWMEANFWGSWGRSKVKKGRLNGYGDATEKMREAGAWSSGVDLRLNHETIYKDEKMTNSTRKWTAEMRRRSLWEDKLQRRARREDELTMAVV